MFVRKLLRRGRVHIHHVAQARFRVAGDIARVNLADATGTENGNFNHRILLGEVFLQL
jgi:hypothetical protein